MILGVPVFEHIMIRLKCGQTLEHLKIILHLEHMENLLPLDVPILKHIMVAVLLMMNCIFRRVLDGEPYLPIQYTDVYSGAAIIKLSILTSLITTVLMKLLC